MSHHCTVQSVFSHDRTTSPTFVTFSPLSSSVLEPDLFRKCDTHEIQGKSRELHGLSYLGHSDLYITNYGILHVWYIPGGSWCRVCYPFSKESKCTLTGSH